MRDDITKAFKNEYLGKYRNSLTNQMLLISAINYYLYQLEQQNILDPEHDNHASIDVAAQRAAWVGSGKAEAAEWDDATVRSNPFKRNAGKILRVLSVNDDGTFICEWGDPPSSGVQDVTVCGNSIVDDGVASIPRASSSEYGVIKPITVYGVEVNNNGALMATARTAENYDSFPSAGFISKRTLENINNRLVKAAMCDGTGAAWTDAERIAALLRMGCTVDDNGFVKWTAQEATQ